MNKEFSIERATNMINHIIEANLVNKKNGHKDNIVPMLVGTHGIGKTAVVKQIAENRGAAYEKINLPNIDDTSFLLGYPRKVYPLKTATGKTLFVEADQINTYLNQGYKQSSIEPQMGYATPMWVINLHKKEESILHLDEINRAPDHIIQSVFELINNGTFGTWSLPDKCTVICTGNPDSGDYNVKHIDGASASRMFTIHVKFDKQAWCTWASGAGINEDCINFIASVDEATDTIGENANGKSAREWTRFFRSLVNVEDMQSPESLEKIMDMGYISVGDHALTFVNYIKNNLNVIPKLSWIFDESTPIEEALGALSECLIDRDTNQQRFDIKGLLGLRLTSYLRGTEKMTKFKLSRLTDLLLSDILHKDSKLMIYMDIVKKNHPHNKELSQLLLNDKIANEFV